MKPVEPVTATRWRSRVMTLAYRDLAIPSLICSTSRRIYFMDSAEFDRFASEYDQLLRQSVAVTGEGPEFFHEYKIRELARLARERKFQPETILDFGSGVGNSTPYFRRYFPSAQLAAADVSPRSLRVAEGRFPGGVGGCE